MIDNPTIKPLSSELADDYFDFFDNRAFTDHEEWSCCYCTYFHFDREREKEVGEIVKAGADLKSTLRSTAAELIREGTLRGYLAYDGDDAIGFVNANDKTAYRRFDGNYARSTFISDNFEEKVKAVTCFIIAPEYRDKGVATLILEQICEDAKREGYTAVEGYPRIYPGHFDFPFNGPKRLFERVGFVKVNERSGAEFKEEHGVIIMRKEL